MDVAINELSFQYSNAQSDVDLLRDLTRALKAIKDRVAHCDRDKVRIRVTDAWAEPRRLPRGTTIGNARQELNEIERALCDCFFTDYPSFPVDDPPVFFHLDQPAHGLGYARSCKLLAASLATGSNAADELWVESRHVEIPSGNAPNAWRSELTQRHVETMTAHVLVLPRYTDPGIHDPDTPHYERGKSHIPRGAKDLFQYAHRDDDEASWWTKCECNFFHRFQGGDPVHWNATTSPRALQPTPENQVPGTIRRYWRNRPGISDCGCR
jgi:hypothetical protein